MSEKKITPERIQELYREKISKVGTPEEKGLPLKNPSQSLVNSTSTSATNNSSSSGDGGGTSANSSGDKK